MLVFRTRCLPVVLYVVSSVSAQVCRQSLGDHISPADCTNALHALFDPFWKRLTQVELQRQRTFHLFDSDPALRLPIEISYKTCSLAVDIDSSEGDTSLGTWQAHRSQLQYLTKKCVIDEGRGLGGTTVPGNGFIYILANPSYFNYAGMCMVNHGPRRMDVIKCLLGIECSSNQVARTLTPLPSPAATGLPQSHPTSPADDGPDLFSTMDWMDESLPGPSNADDSQWEADPWAEETWYDAPAFQPSRTLPPAPEPIERQPWTARLGDLREAVDGTWILNKDNHWIDGYRRRAWKKRGSWYLMKGLGTEKPFPTDVPPWPGGEVWALFGHRQETKRHPLSEAWIAENGAWKPLVGQVPPSGDWVTEGGWVLLRGSDPPSPYTVQESIESW